MIDSPFKLMVLSCVASVSLKRKLFLVFLEPVTKKQGQNCLNNLKTLNITTKKEEEKPRKEHIKINKLIL